MTPPPDDGQFSQSLREYWHVSPQRNSDFRTAVWARIEATRSAPATLNAWLRLNVFRVATFAAASVAIAGTGGGLLATAQADRNREQLVQRYVASIDPHQHTTSTGPR